MSNVEATPEAIAVKWLRTAKVALESIDPKSVAATFLPYGWLRDILTFTWDVHSLRGPDAISSYLSESDRLATSGVSAVKLSDNPHLQPTWSPDPTGAKSGVEAGFDFELPHALGQGYFRLRQDQDGEWRALAVCMMVRDLKGYEEPAGERRSWEQEGAAWEDVDRRRREKIESDPYVLIVGGGHIGLTLAARFNQMDIPALVIERNSRIGDSWRKRYRSLALHTTKNHHQMLYQPFPSNWPEYTPRDRIADWLESYATHQRIVHWLSTDISGKPTYDPSSKRWTVSLNRGGTAATVRPAHIVLATGTHGGPYTPPLAHRGAFAGTVLHAAEYVDAAPFAGKRVAVVGAANTAVDICEDLARGGAAAVTMVQRGSTCVVSRAGIAHTLRALWPDGVPIEVSDFKSFAMPLGAVREFMIMNQEMQWAAERELHAKLRKGGVSLWLGPDGEGQFILGNERAGGFWFDKGAADLIAEGRIKVKQGVEATAYSSTGLVFADGSELSADVIIFATGFTKMRDINKRIFGEDVIDKTCECIGLDSEYELRGHYRPSGHPGLWYAPGEFSIPRFMSKQLAIQIKAIQVGLLEQ